MAIAVQSITTLKMTLEKIQLPPGLDTVPSKKIVSDQSSNSSDDIPTRVTSQADIQTIQTSSGISDQWDTLSLEAPSAAPPAPKKRIGKLLQKTTLCKHFPRGRCRFGEQCSFAHDSTDLLQKPNLTKTRLCAHFKAGHCKKDNCTYAHGAAEVQKRAPAAQPVLQSMSAKVDAMAPRMIDTSFFQTMASPVMEAPEGQEPMKIQDLSFDMSGSKTAKPAFAKQANVKMQVGNSQAPSAYEPGMQMWWPSMVGEYLPECEFQETQWLASEDEARVENLLQILQNDTLSL